MSPRRPRSTTPRPGPGRPEIAVVGDHIAVELGDRARSSCDGRVEREPTQWSPQEEEHQCPDIRSAPVGGRGPQVVSEPGPAPAARTWNARSRFCPGSISVPTPVLVKISEQERVPEPAVDDVGLPDPRLQAGFRQASTLGIIPLSMTPRSIRSRHSSGVRPEIRLVGFVAIHQDARRVGQEHELLGPERLGDGRGGGVGVDVQEPAFLDRLVLGQRGEHRNHAGQAEVLDRLGVDLGHLADPPQVDRAAVPVGQGISFDGRRGTGASSCGAARRPGRRTC